MASLSDKIIIYDDNCPMCAAYTQAFVKLDLLENDGRLGFQAAPETYLQQLDTDRARHEIPLLDRNTGEVHMGRVPAYSVVVSGSMPGKPLPDGSPGPSLYCAVIIKRVDERTRSKTSINDLLRT